MVPFLTGLVGFSYSSVSGVSPVPIPSSQFFYVPRDDSSHALAVTLNATSPNDAFMAFFAVKGRWFTSGNGMRVSVEVENADRTLYFPGQIAWLGNMLDFELSGATLVTGLPAGSYTARLYSAGSTPIYFDGPRHLTVYKVQ